jgi:hypothetical protein
MLIKFYILQYCINTAYFSPLQVKNNPCEGIMNVRFSGICYQGCEQGCFQVKLSSLKWK